MEQEERFARGADRAVTNRELSLKKTGETIDDLASGKVSLTTIKDEVTEKTRKLAETVSDRDKLKQFAKGKLAGWLQGIDDWSKKRSDDQLDDAGELAADAVIDAAAASTMGAVGRGLGGAVEEAAELRKAAKAAAHNRPGSSVSKGDSHVWKKLKSARGKTKTDGERFYEWDHTHGDIEVYDRRGHHLGSMDPSTGAMSKPSVPGRKINL